MNKIEIFKMIQRAIVAIGMGFSIYLLILILRVLNSLTVEINQVHNSLETLYQTLANSWFF